VQNRRDAFVESRRNTGGRVMGVNKTELVELKKDKARLDWLLLGLDIVRIGSSEHLRDLALSACDLAGDWSNAAFVANYLEVCREAIDAAMKKKEE